LIAGYEHLEYHLLINFFNFFNFFFFQDGPDKDPIIYHGYTLTSKVKFEAVLLAIKAHAFDFSPYPLILSIENHCSLEQQEKMAFYFINILGDYLMLPEHLDPNAKQLPSPKELQFKILLKNKKNPPHNNHPGELHVAPLLSDLVKLCIPVKFEDIDDALMFGRPNEMSSFSENKGFKLIQKDPKKMVEYNKRHNSRVYPKGSRVDSR